MLFVDKKSMKTNTFEEACMMVFSNKAEITKTAVFPCMGFGTIEVKSPFEFACGAWDWKEEVHGFKFFRA